MSYPPESGPMTPENRQALEDEEALEYRTPVAIMRERLAGLDAHAANQARMADEWYDKHLRADDLHRIAKAEAQDLRALIERVESEDAAVPTLGRTS